VTTPRGFVNRLRAGAGLPSIRRSSSLAASNPMSSAFGTTLDSGGLHNSQKVSALSTPTTATSSGTCAPRCPQASNTCWPRTSLQAMIPTGRGNEFTHWAIRFRSSSQGCMRKPAQGVSYTLCDSQSGGGMCNSRSSRNTDQPACAFK